MKGRTAMTADDMALLREAVKGKQTYVEIGVLWGGSLIEAANAEPGLKLWGIDPFDGYYGGKDTCLDEWEKPTMADVLANIQDAGIEERVTLVKANSYPFPLPASKFDVGLIDGCHELLCVIRDWESLKKRCKTVLFHDVDDPGIADFVGIIDGWKKTYSGHMARLDRD